MKYLTTIYSNYRQRMAEEEEFSNELETHFILCCIEVYKKEMSSVVNDGGTCRVCTTSFKDSDFDNFRTKFNILEFFQKNQDIQL